jgi:WD40 repeat protein
MVWDTVGLKRVLILPHPDEVVFGAFSEDGRLIATASNDKIARIFDAVTGKEKLALRGHEGKINQVSFSPDGSLLVTASEDSTARMAASCTPSWDTRRPSGPRTSARTASA